jgi:hypothetical protein
MNTLLAIMGTWADMPAARILREMERKERTLTADTVLEMERVMLGVSCTNSKLIRAEDYFYFIGKAKC